MFSQKQNKKCHAITQLDEYKLNLFMMFCMTSFFSISPLHVRWPLPYIMKNNKSKGLSSSSNNEGLILDQSNGKIKLMLIYAVHLVLITEAAPQRCSVEKGVPRNFTEFTGKRLYQSLFFSKLASLSPAKRDSGTSVFL